MVVQSSHPIFCSLLQYPRAPVSLHLLLPLASTSVLSLAVPAGGKWYTIVTLTCVSLMTKNAKHLFRCFLAFYASF